jgi:hypothetical protein
MRLDSAIDSIRAAALPGACPGRALTALQQAVRAQAALARSAMAADRASTGAEGEGVDAASPDTRARALSAAGWLPRDPLSARADAFVNHFSLDDRVGSPQCGWTVGRLMVPVPPQPMRGRSGRVTLWDEIAPPLPMPMPMPVQAAARP